MLLSYNNLSTPHAAGILIWCPKNASAVAAQRGTRQNSLAAVLGQVLGNRSAAGAMLGQALGNPRAAAILIPNLLGQHS